MISYFRRRKMRKYKILIVILAALLLLSSCNTKTPPDTAGTESDYDSNLTPTEAQDTVYLLRDGNAVYDVVYPATSKFSNLSVWVDQIKDALQAQTGVTPRSYDDSVSPKSEFLILCGDTGYEESKAEESRLGVGGCSVCMQGKYIVIQATDESSMVKAVNWFCNTLLKKVKKSEDGKNVTFPFKELREVGTVAQRYMQVNGKELGGFTVVYPKGNDGCMQAARKLLAVCSVDFGVSLKLVDDSFPAVPCEILVGRTNRGESESHHASMPIAPMEYAYSVINGKISILAYDDNGYGLTEACRSFTDHLAVEKKVNLEDGWMKHSEVKLKSDRYAALAEHADVRVMTANLLSEEWGGTECLPRAEIFYANLMYYKPDVVGAQEVSIQWTQALGKVLKDTDYTVLHEVVEGTDSNYCLIIYNTATLEKIESGAYRLAIGGPAKARTVTWAVFQQRATGKNIIVLNTHLDWIANADDYETQGATSHYSREMQVRELAGTFSELQERYPEVDILLTADWNTAKDCHPLNILCELTGVRFAQDMIADNDWGNQVDHIFMTADTKIKALHLYYENGADLGASDHPWGFADIELK